MNHEDVARTVAQLGVLRLKKDIVVVLHGELTRSQKRKVNREKKVNPCRLEKAVRWLLGNNAEWKKHVNGSTMDEIMSALPQPVFVDRSRNCDDHNNSASGGLSMSNTETTETMEIYFPDGYVNNVSHGQSSAREFNELVQKAQEDQDSKWS